jgi:hypothetical protein
MPVDANEVELRALAARQFCEYLGLHACAPPTSTPPPTPATPAWPSASLGTLASHAAATAAAAAAAAVNGEDGGPGAPPPTPLSAPAGASASASGALASPMVPTPIAATPMTSTGGGGTLATTLPWLTSAFGGSGLGTPAPAAAPLDGEVGMRADVRIERHARNAILLPAHQRATGVYYVLEVRSSNPPLLTPRSHTHTQRPPGC